MPSKGVLVCVDANKGNLSSKSSGVSFGNFDIVLVHGLILLPFCREKWFSTMFESLGYELATVTELDEVIEFVVFEEEDVTSPQFMRPGRKMVVAGAWICPLMEMAAKCLGEELRTDEEETSVRCACVFLFLRTSAEVPKNIGLILNELAEPVRGQDVLVEFTPFGIPSAINSVSRGVVCCSFDNFPWLFLTDASTAQGANGGPIYSLANKKRLVVGIVAFPQVLDKDCTGLTLGIALSPVLQRLISPKKASESQLSQPEAQRIDETVVCVTCCGSRGTGIVIDASSGIILTCSHVIPKESERILVYHKRKCYLADLIYKTSDKGYDLAIIKVSSPHFFTSQMEFADSPARIGAIVFAVGFPQLNRKASYVDQSPLITRGCVSKVNPFWIQTTCLVYGGHSGGAIIRDGKLLGVIVCNVKYGSTTHPNVNFSVPTTVFRHHVEKYLKEKNVKHLKNLGKLDKNAKHAWKSSL